MHIIMSGNQNICPRNFKFFRVLLPGFSYKLSLPREFMKYFIEENSTWATILSPLGKSWHVNIHGDNKGLHFVEGWERFAVAHKLSVGDFLVFKYKGGLVFDVTIFDQSTCERDYYVINGIAGDRVPSQEEKYREKGFECLGNQTTLSCGKRTAAMMEQTPSKNMPDGSREKEEQKQARKASKASKGCKREPCFVVTIRPNHKCYMEIPRNIVRSNDLSSIDQLLLRDPKGHLWPAELVHRQYPSQKRSLLGNGWRDFHGRNNLEPGDVCVFELKEKNKLHVQIHRRGGHNSMKISEDDNKKTKRPLHEKSVVESVKGLTTVQQKGSRSRGTSVPDPQFMSTMVPSNLHRNGCLNIPKSFLSSVDLSNESEVVLVDPSSRRWPVNIRRCNTIQGGGRMSMGCGWQTFCDANNLRAGDVCTFSFKSRMQKATFQVEVIKY